MKKRPVRSPSPRAAAVRAVPALGEVRVPLRSEGDLDLPFDIDVTSQRGAERCISKGGVK